MSASLLLTIPETAAELRCHRDTVYELIAAKQLKAVDIATRPGGRTKTRVRRDDLVAFIDARTRTAATRVA